MPAKSNRIIVYKQCKYHKRTAEKLGGAWAESVCGDCRRLTFRATMKARGITVTYPTYKGGYPSHYFGPPGWPEATSPNAPTFAAIA